MTLEEVLREWESAGKGKPSIYVEKLGERVVIHVYRPIRTPDNPHSFKVRGNELTPIIHESKV